MMLSSDQFQSDLAIPPGEYLLEVLENIKMDQTDLAVRTSLPLQTIQKILKGEMLIDPEAALQLEQVLRIPADFWTSLESEYRLLRGKEN